MKRFQQLYFCTLINIIADPGVVLFKVDDIAKAVGYSKPGSVIFHVKKRIKLVGGERYIDLKAINSLAKRATRTPAVLDFKVWAKQIHDKELAQQQAAAHIAKQPKPHADSWPYPPLGKKLDFTIAEAAQKLGMSSDGLADWLISQGYASRYRSNGNLYLIKWFKEQGYGCLPVAKSGNISNTPRITDYGITFIKNRLASERETNVLSFAKSSANERKRLEKELDDLILNTFKPFIEQANYTKYLQGEREYRVDESDLLKKIKGIIAEVKLKEIENGTDKG